MTFAKVKGRVVEKGFTMTNFAKKLEISEVSLNKKINGKSEWKRSEIIKVCEILDISTNELNDYFFCKNS